MIASTVDAQKTIDLLETARNETVDDELMTLFDQLMRAERAHVKGSDVVAGCCRLLPVSRCGV
jgi:hypothetical protein